jgi:hypothetical protein
MWRIWTTARIAIATPATIHAQAIDLCARSDKCNRGDPRCGNRIIRLSSAGVGADSVGQRAFDLAPYRIGRLGSRIYRRTRVSRFRNLALLLPQELHDGRLRRRASTSFV